MGNLFGKKEKKSRVTEQDRAILQLKQQRDSLKQYQKKINANLGKEKTIARQLLKDGKIDKAKLLLRKKKFQEGLLEKTDGQLENIEKLVHDLEFAQIEAEVVKGLQVGNASLKKMHQLISLEDVERIMDETQDGLEYQREMDELLSGGLSEQDEQDVLDELDQIVKASLPDVAAGEGPLNLPDVPSDKIAEKRQKETRTAEALEAS
ncbi:charged multivesicular body protein 6-A-like [Gigantopelta aegis]|uniref:charged multivesicular body protein 6-A-like n=1 Tax=Gigantopelta aegis TaxID=1735272 RepID=UPI001B88934C|nr:charged multivesicular body protein 6-A-like [Gigantopelta aegis]